MKQFRDRSAGQLGLAKKTAVYDFQITEKIYVPRRKFKM